MVHREITIQSNFSAIREVSDLLQDYCSVCQLSPELTGHLELITVEALNNVVEHAYEEKDGSDIFVELIDKPNNFTIRITDHGITAPDNLLSKDATIPNEHTFPEGGWGISLIQALVDSIDYNTQEKTNLLTLTKNKQ